MDSNNALARVAADDVESVAAGGEASHTYTIASPDVAAISRLLDGVLALPAKDYLHFMRHLQYFHGAMSEPARPADRRSR